MFILFVLIGLCAHGAFGAATNLRFRVNSMQLVSVDPEYFDPSNTEVALQNKVEYGPWELENSVLSKATIVKQLPDNTNAHITILALFRGEFTKTTGINVWVKVCDLLKDKFLIGPLLIAMGFSEEACPPGPGTYFQEGYTLPNNTVPAFVPVNQYLTRFEIVADGTSILVIDTVLEIYRVPGSGLRLFS